MLENTPYLKKVRNLFSPSKETIYQKLVQLIRPMFFKKKTPNSFIDLDNLSKKARNPVVIPKTSKTFNSERGFGALD